MKILKAFKFRLEPNQEQVERLNQLCGSTRFAWNKALEICKKMDEKGLKIPTGNQMTGWLPEWKKSPDTSFLEDSNAVALQQKLRDLGDAWKKHTKDREKLEKGFIKELQWGEPRFKKRSKDDDNSFRIVQFSKYCKIENRRVKLPSGLGFIRFRKSRSIDGVIKNCTITRKNARWFISFQTEIELPDDLKHESSSMVGIDVGISKFATLSDGKVYEPLNAFRSKEKALAKSQRQLAKKVKFSENWKKQKVKIGKLQGKIAACRLNYLHKISNEISNNHAMIVIEDLKVRNMSRSAKGTAEKHGKNVKAKSGLNKSLLDQGFYEFRRQLAYKQLWRGGDLVAVKPHYTSQKCSCCGHTHKDNRKSQEKFSCLACGHTENADFNASKNVLASGHGVLACGEFPLGDSMKQEPVRNREAVSP